MNLAASLLRISAFVGANPHLLVERIFLVVPPRHGRKSFALRLLELIVLYFIVGGSGLLLESQRGEIHPQGWAFYAITAVLFIVLAYPGFAYRYLRRRRVA